MNYKNFSTVYGALCVAENEKMMSIENKNVIVFGKRGAQAMFNENFSAPDFLKKPDFNSIEFLGFVASFPEIIKRNVERFLQYLTLMAKMQKLEAKSGIKITLDALAILNSQPIEDYVWERSSGRKEAILAAAVNAVQPLMLAHKEHPEVVKLSEKIESWLIGYPHLADYLAKPECVGSEQWL